VYTSGTTGKPKGVVLSQQNLGAQVGSLQEAWGWEQEDRILHTLPLHHLHGIVNVLVCSLASGATCELLPKFDAGGVWDALARERADPRALSLFMAVPTIYSMLIRSYDEMEASRRRGLAEVLRDGQRSRIRLMVSGSASLPPAVMQRWKEITGHTLLERFGMTEIGMALSNPLHGERKPSSVGFPLPGISVKLVDEKTRKEIKEDGISGELLVKGFSSSYLSYRLPIPHHYHPFHFFFFFLLSCELCPLPFHRRSSFQGIPRQRGGNQKSI